MGATGSFGAFVFAASLPLLLCAPTAAAAPITFGLGGVIDLDLDVANEFAGVGVGTTFSGSYTFESTTPDANANVQIGGYTGALTAFVLTIGAQTLVFEPTQPGNSIVVSNDVGFGGFSDRYTIQANFAGIGSYPDVQLTVGIAETSSQANFFNDDALPLEAAFFASPFATGAFTLNFLGPQASLGRLGGSVTSLTSPTAQQLSAPSVLALLGAGLVALALRRPRRR